MSKLKKENCRTISIYKLRDWGCFKSDFHSGQINWTNNWSEKKNSVNYEIDLSNPDDMYFKLDYTITDRFSGEKREISQKYPLVKTSCNYGGERYWFICSLYCKGQYCGRKVAKFYLGGSDYFACRHCYDLTYESRMGDLAWHLPDIEEFQNKMKRWYYKGKLTKKHRKLLKMYDKNDRSMEKLLYKINKYR